MAASTGAGGDGPPASYGTVFTNEKAGMADVDKERVKRVVRSFGLLVACLPLSSRCIVCIRQQKPITSLPGAGVRDE